MKRDIDMPSTRSRAVHHRHRLTHQQPPRRWQDGFPLGNGRLGVMVWGDGAPLSFTLDHANLWDLRHDPAALADPGHTYAALRELIAAGHFDAARERFEERFLRDNPVTPTKLYAGRAELDLGSAQGYRGHLDLRRAVVEGRLRTAGGTCGIRAFVHHDLSVFCLRLTGTLPDPGLRLVPLAATGPELAKLGLPEPIRRVEDGLCVLGQEVPGSACYALVWNLQGPEYIVAIETAATLAAAEALARQTWRQAQARGFACLLREHTAAWRRFWSGAAVFLPEADLEFLWHYGIYLLAASARPGARPPGLQGVWAMDGILPPWRGDYHSDMNVQETFWPAAPTGHLELLDCWCDEMQAAAERATACTQRFFGTEGTFWPCSWLPEFTPVPCWYTVQYAWSHSGWLGWLVWLRWRYSLDAAWLRRTGYPLLAGIFRFYRANLEVGEDGRLHVPLSTSPEYHENNPDAWARDPNIDIALIRRVCDWLVEMESALGVAELSAAARTVHEQLPPYALSAAGALSLWPGKPLDESHRHPSHLMAIHPAMDLTIEGSAAEQGVVAASVAQFLDLGQYRWAGHTYGQWTSLAAVLGRGGLAYDSARQFADHWVTPNGLHCNRELRQAGRSCYTYSPAALAPFTLEASCGLTAGLCDMLVQGWGDVVRVFPAVPAHWRDVACRDLLAEGAFRVSALRLDGETQWVRVRAGVARQLRLRDPFAGAEFEVDGPAVRRAGQDLLAELRQGQTVTLRRQGSRVTLAQAVARIGQGERSWLGLR
jgi:alpha-L-fucosidase 2